MVVQHDQVEVSQEYKVGLTLKIQSTEFTNINKQEKKNTIICHSR